ncbi:hypothetical protein HPB50_007186 [Hyalomma asiaticum]|uniref:Uncharacterized protein n=1 Tax=Hyalomma asiaticum TaxID=266040 RepID=A0ACB7RJI4_HYAAI|nr:hypothetical protein HPB50_007186 [Hyalomma asiaticum]
MGTSSGVPLDLDFENPALLFYSEAHVNLGMNKVSPTDVPCKWIEASGKTAAAPVSEINSFKPKVGAPAPQPTPKAQKDVPLSTDEKVRSFCSQLMATEESSGSRCPGPAIRSEVRSSARWYLEIF